MIGDIIVRFSVLTVRTGGPVVVPFGSNAVWVSAIGTLADQYCDAEDRNGGLQTIAREAVYYYRINTIIKLAAGVRRNNIS